MILRWFKFHRIDLKGDTFLVLAKCPERAREIWVNSSGKQKEKENWTFYEIEKETIVKGVEMPVLHF